MATGQWAENYLNGGNGGGGAGIVWVTGLMSVASVQNPSMTYQELEEAYSSGAMIFFRGYAVPPEYGNQSEVYPLRAHYVYDAETDDFIFSGTYNNKTREIKCNRANNWTITTA